MADQPAFIRKQYEFSAHIRNPQTNPRPDDVEARRMNIYTELFYNNVEGFMSSSYPVLREIHDDESWHHIIRDYFHKHKAKTPLFPEMPREFLHYLENERHPEQSDYPFMLELAHYEWAELALSLSEQEPELTNVDTNGNLLQGLPVISPLVWTLSYHWPVHQIGPEYLPDSQPDTMTYLLLYRDRDDEVHFLEINPVTARLLQLIEEEFLASTEIMLQQIAKELNHPDPQIVIQGGLSIVQDLSQRNIILGVNKN